MSGPEPTFDRSSTPAAGPIRPFHLPELGADSLPNGLRVRSMFRGSVPLVSACLVMDAGEATVPRGRDGVAVLAGDGLLGGTAHRSGTELAEALEGLGSGLRVSTGWDATTLSFTCVAERLDEMLTLVSEVVREPAFPRDEIQRMRNEQSALIRQRRMDPGRLADDELDRAVFSPDHPYHRPVAGDEATVSALDRESAAGFASERHGPGSGGVVLVGDLSWDRVSELARGHFGAWRSTRTEVPRVGSVEPTPGRRVVIVDRPGAVQSEIRIGHPGPARGHPDEMALRVANTVLGGAFTSRLNLSLREKHGFTYGAHSSFVFRRAAGAFSFGTAVQTEVTGRALSEAASVLNAFADDGPTAEELSRARDYLAGVFPLRMETTAQLAARIAELIIFDLPDDYHHTYRDRIRAVGLDRATAAVRAHVKPESFRVVIVGDADRIGSEIAGLGLGEVEVAAP